MIKNRKAYRKNVAMVTFKDSEFLLVNLKTWPKKFWKFPQGGVNKKETFRKAIKREFKEELGTEKLEIIAKSAIKRKYRWDKPKRINDIEYVGQDQTFFIVKYLGEKNDLKIKKDEIRKYCWVRGSSLEKLIRRKEYGFEDYWKSIEKILLEQKILIKPAR